MLTEKHEALKRDGRTFHRPGSAATRLQELPHVPTNPRAHFNPLFCPTAEMNNRFQ